MTHAAGNSDARNPAETEREIGRHHHHAPATDPTTPPTTLIVIAALHGNEPAGIHAARRVLDQLHRTQPGSFNGRLIALRGNIAALRHPDPQTRYIAHDLNRLFTDEQIALPPSTSPEHQQMHELLDTLNQIKQTSGPVVLIDLHTTSSHSPPAVVLEDAIPTRRLARTMPLPIYLGFEEELPGLLADRATTLLGARTMIVEGGQHEDPRAIDVHEAVIWSVLDATGILPTTPAPDTPTPHDTLREAAGDSAGLVADIRHRRPIGHPSFAINPAIRPDQKIKRDATIIATENDRAITSPVRGQVFMPNMQLHKRPGDDGFFIVRPVGEGWLALSARLRRQHRLHAIIARMPGVYPQHDHTLLVDADLAAVLRRQILHLFGYRLIRHNQRSGGHGIRRVINGIGAFTRALLRGPIKDAPDRDDPRFWIVQRHTLDRQQP